MSFDVVGEYAKNLIAKKIVIYVYKTKTALCVYGDCAKWLPRMSSLAKKWLSIKQKMLYAYTETALNSKISTESVYNSVDNNTNNLDSFYLHYME
jgi:hypothetical protein